MNFLVKLDLEFDLKSEISDGKKLVKFGGGLFGLAGKVGKSRRDSRGKFRSRFRGKFRKLCFKFRDFFGNFVQQKGGANESVHGRC